MLQLHFAAYLSFSEIFNLFLAYSMRIKFTSNYFAIQNILNIGSSDFSTPIWKTSLKWTVRMNEIQRSWCNKGHGERVLPVGD